MKYILLLFSVCLISCTSTKIVHEQGTVTHYHDVGTNAQEIAVQEELTVSQVSISLMANSWGEDALGKGSDVLILMQNSKDDNLLGVAIIPRVDVPLEKGQWVTASFNDRFKLSPKNKYILKIVELSSGGAKGWNEYGFARGNLYPQGKLVKDFNSKHKMDYAFKLFE